MSSLSKAAITKLHASIIIVVVVAVIALGAYSYMSMSTPPKARLIVSTTTSLYETGVLDALKTSFEAKYPNMNVSFISQGTGLAIQTAMRGDADMILVHAPTSEYLFLNGSYGVNRKILAYNFFIIVGPSNDPARIAGMGAKEALMAIRTTGLNGTALWVSRGDNSGTYTKEVSLWKSIGLDVKDLRTEKWYLEAGSGMTATLQLANEKRAYTLSDTGTYLQNFDNHNIDLVKLVSASKSLLNVYSAIADNPNNANMTKTNFEGAMQFIEYLVSDDGQNVFANYGVSQYNQSLFSPYVPLAQSQSNQTLLGWIQSYAFFQGSECPSQFRYQADDLYSTQGILSELILLVPLTWIGRLRSGSDL
ncbi:MAG: substrate-binding domain-containing protein [Candidatus Bathyarchaeia archaeon]|jgi:tungstate transport system substrate-binding protein